MRSLLSVALLGATLAAAGGCTPADTSASALPSGVDPSFELLNPPELTPDGDGVFQIVAGFEDREIRHAFGAIPLPQIRAIATGDADKRAVAPTVRVKTGADFGFDLVNAMPYSPATGDDRMSATLPHGFNVMNLHTHGMHVANLQDNVLINVFGQGAPTDVVARCNEETYGDAPCVVGNHPYRYWVMRTHPSGTYWYHPHKHGAVALHLASGMGGALIVEDEEKGIESLETVKRLKAANYKGRAERVMVFQHILYETESGRNVVDCSTVYSFSTDCFDGSTPVERRADQINQRMTVNGQERPIVTMDRNETQLWRMVNAGAGDVLALCRVPIGISPDAAPDMRVLAVDGNPVEYPSTYKELLSVGPPTPDLGAPTDPSQVKPTSRDVVRNEVAFLAAGQRMDVLVSAPAVGSYAILHAYHPDDPTADPIRMSDLCPKRLDPAEAHKRAVMYVNVLPAFGDRPPEIAPPTPVEVANLVSPSDLTGDPVYNPQPPRNPIPTQGVAFGFSTLTYGAAAGGGSTINGRVFNGGEMQRTLQFGKTDL
ncbi:MAG: multicopper oxidase domain-containing protein [Marivibrio sp.]|uniref:multicopper oxidase domain-containing protein n=1 Tax=Marivibrio sp. TaxID=2039719 RepID=UPI0032EEF00F